MILPLAGQSIDDVSIGSLFRDDFAADLRVAKVFMRCIFCLSWINQMLKIPLLLFYHPADDSRLFIQIYHVSYLISLQTLYYYIQLIICIKVALDCTCF